MTESEQAYVDALLLRIEILEELLKRRDTLPPDFMPRDPA